MKTEDIDDIAAMPPSFSWLARWEPEGGQFWESEGKRITWRTLTITTINWWSYTHKGCEKPS